MRFGSGAFTVSLPDSGGSGLPLTEGASLVVIYRVLSPNFPLKSIVIYDGSAIPTASTTQNVQGFYDALGGAGTGEITILFYCWRSLEQQLQFRLARGTREPIQRAAECRQRLCRGDFLHARDQ